MAFEMSPLALREALAAHGLVPRFHAARTAAEAAHAAAELGTPVLVRPAEQYASAGTRVVTHPEDMPLAFAVACRNGAQTVIIESWEEGPRFYVSGTVDGGRLARTTIAGRDLSEAPYCFDWAVYAPVETASSVGDTLAVAAERLRGALGLGHGAFSMDVSVSGGTPIIWAVYGNDILAPWFGNETDTGKGMAVAWIHSRSGVVTTVRGVKEACEVPGVQDIHIGIQPGDVLRHITDDRTRDRMGYVRATAENGHAALAVARRACAVIAVETRPTL